MAQEVPEVLYKQFNSDLLNIQIIYVILLLILSSLINLSVLFTAQPRKTREILRSTIFKTLRF